VQRSNPAQPQGAYGLERRPPVGTAGRRPADDVTLRARMAGHDAAQPDALCGPPGRVPA